MQKILLITIFLVSLLTIANAQNVDNLSTLATFNQMYYNPGYAGDGTEIEARGIIRNQWMGFKGAPNVTVFNIDGPFKLFGLRHGAGLSLGQDGFGNFKNTIINVSYAYRRSMLQGEVGIGVGLMFNNHGYSGEWITGIENSSSLDAGYPSSEGQTMVFDGNIGVYYSADNLFMGLSVKNISNTEVKYKNESGISSGSTYAPRQVTFSTGYRYQLLNPMFAIKPSAYIISDFKTAQVNLCGILSYNNRFFGGLGFLQPIGLGGDGYVLFGVDLLSGFSAAVSYGLATSRIFSYSSGTFEFMVGYSFSLEIDKDARKYKSVRFL